MYAITGITGKVGGALARALLRAHHPIRAIVRDIDKGRFWASHGCEIALADMRDTTALTAAFTGAVGVFILPPSEFDPAPGFPKRGPSLLPSKQRSSRPALVKSSACRRSAPSRRDPICSRNARSWSRPLVSYRCQSLFFGQAGSWRTPSGMSRRRGPTESSPASCNLSTNRCPWSPQQT
jgi:NmrA-like family